MVKSAPNALTRGLRVKTGVLRGERPPCGPKKGFCSPLGVIFTIAGFYETKGSNVKEIIRPSFDRLGNNLMSHVVKCPPPTKS